MEQGFFLQKLSDALEESKNKISFPLPVGSTIFSNNYFWLHGRKAFNEHSGLSRELLRIRGTFFQLIRIILKIYVVDSNSIFF